MIYRHTNFILDTKYRKVFDENNKEIRLTGNAYRVLVFLCENGPSNLTEIGDELDRMKNYDEDHIRQYRYKINSIIGREVMKYENKIYFIYGKVEKINSENLPILNEKERITDLLHDDSLKLRYMENVIKFSIGPALIASFLMVVSTFSFSFPYGFYTILKFVVMGATLYYAYYIYKVRKVQDFWFWSFVVIAILFNPFIPVYLRSKAIWEMIDLITIAILVLFTFRYKEKKV